MLERELLFRSGCGDLRRLFREGVVLVIVLKGSSCIAIAAATMFGKFPLKALFSTKEVVK